MYTARINRKDYVNGVVRVFVDFSDGTDTYTEYCIPQDENGFKFWVKSRLATFNSKETIEATYADGAEVVVDTPVEPPVLTAEEIARNEWFAHYSKWVKVKTTLIDTGVLTGNETKVLALQNKVKADFLPAYLDFM